MKRLKNAEFELWKRQGKPHGQDREIGLLPRRNSVRNDSRLSTNWASGEPWMRFWGSVNVPWDQDKRRRA